MNIFIPYNKKYILKTYDFDSYHASFIQDVVLRNLLKRLIKSKKVNRIDIYSQDEDIITGIYSKKLNFIESISDESQKSEQIMKDYLSITKIAEPVVYYNLMFPFTEIEKLYEAFLDVKLGKFESATGIIPKGIVWSEENIFEIDSSSTTPSQDEINTGLDVGSFCVIKPKNILSGLRRTTPPIKIVPLASLELVNMRNFVDKELYQLIVSSGMPL